MSTKAAGRKPMSAQEVGKINAASMKTLGDVKARRQWADSESGSPVTTNVLCAEIARLNIERDARSPAFEAMREALRPFAHWISVRDTDSVTEGVPDSCELAYSFVPNNDAPTIGDLRRAREALALAEATERGEHRKGLASVRAELSEAQVVLGTDQRAIEDNARLREELEQLNSETVPELLADNARLRALITKLAVELECTQPHVLEDNRHRAALIARAKAESGT